MQQLQPLMHVKQDKRSASSRAPMAARARFKRHMKAQSRRRVRNAERVVAEQRLVAREIVSTFDAQRGDN